MKVHMVADNKKHDNNMEIQSGESVGHGGWFIIGLKLFRPKATWLAHLLRFVSLFLEKL